MYNEDNDYCCGGEGCIYCEPIEPIDRVRFAGRRSAYFTDEMDLSKQPLDFVPKHVDNPRNTYSWCFIGAQYPHSFAFDCLLWTLRNCEYKRPVP